MTLQSLLHSFTGFTQVGSHSSESQAVYREVSPHTAEREREVDAATRIGPLTRHFCGGSGNQHNESEEGQHVQLMKFHRPRASLYATLINPPSETCHSAL